MKAEPNDALAAFTEYAADHLWVVSPLMQLAGVALMVTALLFLAQQLESVNGTGLPRIAAGGAFASLALAAVLQAVDGIALKAMVDAWAVAPVEQKEFAFHAAFAVRQVGNWVSQYGQSHVRYHCDVYGLALLNLDTRGSPFRALN